MQPLDGPVHSQCSLAIIFPRILMYKEPGPFKQSKREYADRPVHSQCSLLGQFTASVPYWASSQPVFPINTLQDGPMQHSDGPVHSQCSLADTADGPIATFKWSSA